RLSLTFGVSADFLKK
ncbi:hypothetical protein MK338_11980, partial [Streptococcus vestibularis]|nr:hypothetical protein [Streptococcus vestibularis]